MGKPARPVSRSRAQVHTVWLRRSTCRAQPPGGYNTAVMSGGLPKSFKNKTGRRNKSTVRFTVKRKQSFWGFTRGQFPCLSTPHLSDTHRNSLKEILGKYTRPRNYFTTNYRMSSNSTYVQVFTSWKLRIDWSNATLRNEFFYVCCAGLICT